MKRMTGKTWRYWLALFHRGLLVCGAAASASAGASAGDWHLKVGVGGGVNTVSVGGQ